jgi:hypothetical protein
MKKHFLLLAFISTTVFVSAQINNEKEPYMTRSLTADAIQSVEAKTSGGSISVTGVASSEARIEVYVSGNNNQQLSKEEIKQRLDELYNLDIAVANNKLAASAKTKANIKDWKKALNIAYRIYVPQTASSDLSTSGGSIHLTNLSGAQSFSTSGGSLHLKSLSGKLDGKTSGGSIHLEDSRNDMDLQTSGGSIHAKNCSGNIRLQTSGGSLELHDLQGTIKASTSGGDVRGSSVEGELIAHTSGGNVRLTDLKSSLETSTSGGNIDVSFKELGKYVKVNNSAGNVNISLPGGKGLDLDLSGNIEKTSFSNFSGKIDDNEVKGKLNGGGVPVTVHAGAGRIRINMR